MSSLLVTLLLTIGGALGEQLVKNPKLQSIIAGAITGTENLVAVLTGKGAGSVAAPAFMAVLQAAIGVLESEGILTTDEVTALTDAITATLAADKAGQAAVDPTTIATPITLVP